MPLPAISIRALRAFIAVYEEQSFSRAAERENATQSGMSTQVKTLETRLGTDLLTRDRKAFALTPAGQIVYREGQQILRALATTEQSVRELRGAITGMVRFGMIPTLTRAVLIPAIQGFKADFPEVEVTLIEEYSYSLIRRVLEGEVEFAVVPAGDLPEGLTARFIGRDREMLVSRPGSLGVPHLAAVPVTALEGRRLIVPSGLNVRRRRIDSVLKSHGVHLAEILEMDGMLATLEMVGATEWMAILPGAICYPDRSGSLRALNVVSDPPMTSDYVIVQKAEAAPSRAGDLLAQRIATETEAILQDWNAIAGIA